MGSFVNPFQRWSVFTASLSCSCKARKGQRGGFIIQESTELMKDVVPFNFISFTTALSLPFAEHKQMKHSRAIHLLGHQTVLLLGIARTPGHTHAPRHTSFCIRSKKQSFLITAGVFTFEMKETEDREIRPQL